MASPIYANLEPTASTANTASVLAANHRHHHGRHSSAEALLFANLIATII
jgi:hypothetical protein